MCDCIKTIGESVLKHVTESHAEKNETVLPIKSWDGEGVLNTFFGLIRELDTHEVTGTQLGTHFVYRYTFEKKDKTTSKPKVMNVSLTYNYCPFCGEPYKVPKDAIKVEEIFAEAIAPFCIEVCNIEKPILALLAAINEFNKTEYTGIEFQDKVAYGIDGENVISWHEFMNSFVKKPFINNVS